LAGCECMEPYQGDEKSSSLCMLMGSKESEASGVDGDGERDPVAVVDDADIVDAISESKRETGLSMSACSAKRITTSFGNFRP